MKYYFKTGLEKYYFKYYLLNVISILGKIFVLETFNSECYLPHLGIQI
jgi:hypothetical protein